MPFKRFFGRGNDEPTPPPPDDEPEDEGEEGLAPEAELAADEIDRDWRERAAVVIPGGTSTASKRPVSLYGPDSQVGPAHFTSAQGCRVTTPSGRTLVDCTMALGAVAIGYGDDAINRAVLSAVANGNVCGLASTAEVELAERLCEVVPCAEQVRFLKSGGEAMAAAVRIARTATGRTTVVGCGYFGWQDWCSRAAGVPAGASADYVEVPFNDVAALERAARAAGSALAAIALEPVVNELPSPEWCATARRLCDAVGAVLIFDEMKTGFRLATGGYQQFAGIEPDLAAFGKAMANGFPLAAVVGRAAIMEAAESTWISVTLAGEATALAAASAVLDIHAEIDVCATLWRVGKEMRERVAAAVQASGVPGVRVTGIDPMWSIEFDDERRQRAFLEGAALEGVLFKRGAYNYASMAHDDDEILLEIERVASTALVDVSEDEEA
ncbi:MAG TPA: aminotransferase class III-fold pyridoxal phosphate-dependent enzyme [Gemmatimonadaceae bacterium]|jgi:glutamate-1-semialdehyde 2,1-aminomutase|nr:aminotransferase class III-fold pyridoxal phosphate-dependent enzyme [Gemmatimonadota bacterium]HNV74497.1 aminotransferase class III-fold pyridoxal phosphate-dependent enzyme [Gemmatimonadaceae bacterium]HPV76994.1 aminotransferase class III-fold pyridoxal phosphate-dependent enzyme [Gemmatimonadaceae bacterium]